MRRAMLAVAAAMMIVGSIGCHHNVCNHGCRGGHGIAGHGHGANSPDHVPRIRGGHHGPPVAGPAGPPSGSYAYPYYTSRAPRDFLMPQPPSIGY